MNNQREQFNCLLVFTFSDAQCSYSEQCIEGNRQYPGRHSNFEGVQKMLFGLLTISQTDKRLAELLHRIRDAPAIAHFPEKCLAFLLQSPRFSIVPFQLEDCAKITE